MVPRPLGEFRLGPGFLDSLDALEGADPQNVAEVVCHVVAGRAHQLHGLQVHQLRQSLGGDTAQRVRSDGAKAWRCAVQVNTPSARRLHWRVLPDGSVELDRVSVHDDV